jgi:hypothetical protein
MGGDDYVFTTGWGGPVYPDTVSSLIGDLIRTHNLTVGEGGARELLPHARLHYEACPRHNFVWLPSWLPAWLSRRDNDWMLPCRVWLATLDGECVGVRGGLDGGHV